MSSNSDYYKILGISKDASEADIKKAYRKAALKYHPDKNTNNKEEAEKKFKMVGEAYQILSNPDERAAYDKYGKAGVNGGGGSAGAGGMRHYTEFSSTEADELFRQFFASGDMADIFSNIYLALSVRYYHMNNSFKCVIFKLFREYQLKPKAFFYNLHYIHYQFDL